MLSEKKKIKLSKIKNTVSTTMYVMLPVACNISKI